MKSQKLFCFAHRGASGQEPENTLRAVRQALKLGADGIEVDVHLADGKLMVIHDDTLERTTDGHGRVAVKSFAYLRSLDAGGGQRIPTLAEVFESVNRQALINVELKGPGTAAPVTALIAKFVNRHGWTCNDFVVSSFDHQQLHEVKRFAPEIRIGVLMTKIPRQLAEFAEKLGAWSLHISKRCVTERFVSAVHQLGLKLFVFTVNEPHDFVRMKGLGVDGVFTDFPERVGSCHAMI